MVKWQVTKMSWFRARFLTLASEQIYHDKQWSVRIALAAETVYDSRAAILKHMRTSAGEQEYEHS